jgi:hypothetical protein
MKNIGPAAYQGFRRAELVMRVGQERQLLKMKKVNDCPAVCQGNAGPDAGVQAQWLVVKMRAVDLLVQEGCACHLRIWTDCVQLQHLG